MATRWGSALVQLLAQVDDAVEAAADFDHERLPECFAGLERSVFFAIPVRYPTVCHPQAWAAGSVPHLLTTILGLEPHAFERRLRIVRPRLPRFVDHLELDGLAVGGVDGDLVVEVVPAGATTGPAVTAATLSPDVAGE